MTLVAQTFDQLINFTRTSAGTFVGSNGLIQNTPASVNLLTFTQEFDNAAWNKAAGSVIVTANSTTAPDGTPTADTITESTGTGTHNIYSSFTSVSGSTYAWSGYVKANGRTIVQLNCQGTGLLYTPEFDLVALTTVTRVGSGTATITAVGDGWLRITAVTAATGSGTGYWQLNLCSAANTPNYTGNGTSGVFLWGAQVELGATATTYDRNFGGLFPPRFDFDPVTLLPRGLLIEEQRTNLLLRSDNFLAAWTGPPTTGTVTANAAVSPDGTSNASLFAPAATTANHDIQQSVTTTAAAHTLSVYAKPAGQNWLFLACFDGTTKSAYFNVSTGVVGTTVGSPTTTITPAGNDWYRCAITFTPTAAANPFFIASAPANGGRATAGDGTSGLYIWGAQLELGAFATSYIPTVASQVTRTVDAATIAAPNFAPWYNQSEGTIFVEATAYAGTNSNRYYEFNDGTGSNLIQGFASPSTINTCWVDVGGVGQARLSTSGSPTALTKIAAAVRLNDFAASLNGAAPATDISGTLPTVNRLGIGNNPTGTSALNGHIRSIRYYPTRLTNATLQALTA